MIGQITGVKAARGDGNWGEQAGETLPTATVRGMGRDLCDYWGMLADIGAFHSFFGCELR